MFDLKINLIDIHSHLLPVQDGPKNMEQAIRAIQIAKGNNIVKIILTPHYFSGDTGYCLSHVKQTYEELKRTIQKRGIDMQLGLGNECVIDERIIDDIQSGKALTLDGTQYILCEYPFYQVPLNYMNILYKLIDNAYKPIIAHPERNMYFVSHYDSIVEMIQNGCMLQVNAESILGRYGSTCKKNAYKLIKNKMAGFMASDAHSDTGRSPELLKKAYLRLNKIVDDDYRRVLNSENRMI